MIQRQPEPDGLAGAGAFGPAVTKAEPSTDYPCAVSVADYVLRHCHGGQLPLPWWRAHERTQARVVGMMANRPRHTNSDYEKLLREKEKLGWRIQKTSGHFKAYCPCSCLCIVIVPSTPSAQGTLTKIRAIFKRCKEGR